VPDVVNRHVGPFAVCPAIVLLTIFQKYVTPVCNPEAR
jgi:hypothetical protein